MKTTLIVLIGILAGLSLAGKGADLNMPVSLKYQSLNRAPDAVVSASSYRRGRFSEVMGGSIMLYAPRAWNHWTPAYAADRDSETYWASEPGKKEWLELELGNRLMPEVPLQRIVLEWGPDRSHNYDILVSSDRQEYHTLKQVMFEGTDQRVFELEKPVPARFLKLEFHDRKSVSIREIMVFGPDQEPMPAPPTSLQAQALSNTGAFH